MSEQNSPVVPRRLAARLSAAMGKVGFVEKDATNPHFGYRYASAGAILRRVQQALSEEGIAITVEPDLVSVEDVKTRRGGDERLVTLKVRVVYHDSVTDETLNVWAWGQGQDSGDKAYAKAMTMGVKYAHTLALCIPTGDDPEADGATDAANDVSERIDESRVEKARAEMVGLSEALAGSGHGMPAALALAVASAKPLRQILPREIYSHGLTVLFSRALVECTDDDGLHAVSAAINDAREARALASDDVAVLRQGHTTAVARIRPPAPPPAAPPVKEDAPLPVVPPADPAPVTAPDLTPVAVASTAPVPSESCVKALEMLRAATSPEEVDAVVKAVPQSVARKRITRAEASEILSTAATKSLALKGVTP